MNGQGKLLTHYLKNADKLIIPVYQRNYDWREEHCKKLYQDLVRTIQNKKRWHFFGGIVSVSDPMGSSSDYLVIDGQQRITTVSLLLLAMANLIKDGKVVPEDDTLYAQITKKYLVDEINPKNRKVKLKPIKGDQDAYDRLWGDPENFARSSNITQNYLFFYNEIQKQAITIDQLFKAVEKLQIIDITLTPPDDDPQLVFESLNSTGLELNEGDKIRNFVLMGLDIEEQERYYDSYWNPIEKNAGYDKQNNSYDVSPFIRDYLSIKNKKISSMKDIYTDFKAFADKRTGEMEVIMKDLLAYAKRYNKLLVGHQSFPTKLKASIFRLNRFESSVTRPFLMEVLRLQEEGVLTVDEVTETCRIVESYLLRRIICDLPSNTLAKVFLTLSSDIRRFDGTYNMFIEKLKYVLTSKKEKAAFPDDEAFAESKNAREEDGFTIVNVAGVRWFTNLKSVQHQGGVSLEGNYYSPDQNPKYLNYDAIDVESVNKIPCDYEGEMGVPISIFDKLDTDQFELVGIMSNPETLPGIRVIGPEWVDLYRSQGGTGHITANMKSLVGIDANGNAVSYYERVIIRNKNPKPRRNI